MLVHPRCQNSDFNRIEKHVIGIRIAKAVPLFARRNGPAFGFIHLRRLPDIEKPAVRLFPQPLDLFAKMQSSFY